MKSNTAYKFIFALILLSAAGYGFFYLHSAIKVKMADVQAYRVKEMQNRNLDFGNSLRENMRTLVSQESRIKGAFIPSTGMVEFIRTLENLAEQNGLEIVISSVEQGEPQALVEGSGKTSPVTFNIQVEGPYAQTVLFMDQVTRLEQKLSITNVSIYKVGQDYAAKAAIAGIILSYE